MRRNLSLLPRWEALREPSSDSSEDEADAQDDMDDQITEDDQPVDAALHTRPTSSHSLAQAVSQKKRKDSDSGSLSERNKKRARHEQDASSSRAGGDRRGGVSGSGELDSGRSAGPSRAGASGPRPSAASTSASAPVPRSSARKLPSRPPVSSSSARSNAAASSSKPPSSASSSQRNEYQSKLSDMFKPKSSSTQATQASKVQPPTGPPDNANLIDLTLDSDDDNIPLPHPKPKPKSKPRASMPNTDEVIDMSDEERKAREASSSSSTGPRPRSRMRKSTGDIGKPKKTTLPVNEEDIILISSDEEERKQRQMAVLVRRPPVSMRKSMPERPVAGPSSSSVQKPPSQVRPAVQATQIPAPAPSARPAEPKTPVSAAKAAERTRPELPTRRGTGMGLASPLSAHTFSSSSTLASKAPVSRTVDNGENDDDVRMSVDHGPPSPRVSELNVDKPHGHRPSTLIDATVPLTSNPVLPQNQKQNQATTAMQVDPAPPSRAGPSFARPKTPTSTAGGSITHKRVPSASSGARAPISAAPSVSKPSSPARTHRSSLSSDSRSSGRRTSQQMQMPPPTMEVDQPRPPSSARLPTPRTPTNTAVDSMTHKRVPSTSSSTFATTPVPPVSRPSSPVKTHRLSSSLDVRSQEKRVSQPAQPRTAEVVQTRPVSATKAPVSAASAPNPDDASTSSMAHKRVPSSNLATPSLSRSQPQPASEPASPSRPRPTQVPQKLVKVAVKSTGNARPRLPQNRSPPASSSPAESGSESDGQSDSSGSRKGEESGNMSVSRPPSTSPPLANEVDMRDLDQALGLTELDPAPARTSPTEAFRSPPRSAPVKAQPTSPQMLRATASQAHLARKSTGNRGMSMLPQVIMEAMQSNVDLHERRRAPPSQPAAEATPADKPREVIDLTLDSSDDEADQTDNRNEDMGRRMNDVVAADLPSVQAIVETADRVDMLSRQEDFGASAAPAVAAISSRTTPGTDELLLRPTPDDNEPIERVPTPPPSSPSPPPPHSADTPSLHEADVPFASATMDTRPRPFMGSRHHSAPSNSSIQGRATQKPPSSPVGPSTTSVSQPPPVSRPQMRPASISSINEILAQKSMVPEAYPATKLSTVPSVSAESPVSPAHRPFMSSPLRQEQRALLSKSGSSAEPVLAREASPVPESPQRLSAKALGKQRRVVESDDDMDGDLPPSSPPEGFFTQSDDEAIQEAEEVQALMDMGGEETSSSNSSNDHDIEDMAAEPELDDVLPRAELLSLGTSDSEAGPSTAVRRSSRRSSRSSSSVQSFENFSDEEVVVPAVSIPPSRATTPEESVNLAEGASPIKRKTYGGFEALTWREYRKDLRNFIPECKYAKDLPHSFHDNINQMSLHTRMMPEMRVVFEGMIRENTVGDEPTAPPIVLENDVDNEPTPPWEFYYTNEMWHGEGVPPPDITNLVSCDCKDKCNPKSKTCACLKRQRDAVKEDPTLDFAFDKAGKLKVKQQYPIFECNDLCGCGPECQNRVVQHGRKVQVVVKKTQHKGWGVFAGPRKIPSKTFIGIYSGELLTDSEAHTRGISYNKAGRTYLFDLDFHHLKTDDPDWKIQYTVDAFHAGNFTRFLNHSCDPNTEIYPCYINEGNIQKPLLVVFSKRDIDAGEEICFSYFGDNDDDDEQEDESDDKGKEEGQRDKVYGACMCGAKKCRGRLFT